MFYNRFEKSALFVVSMHAAGRKIRFQCLQFPFHNTFSNQDQYLSGNIDSAQIYFLGPVQ
jgi:hypothetical protein